MPRTRRTFLQTAAVATAAGAGFPGRTLEATAAAAPRSAGLTFNELLRGAGAGFFLQRFTGAEVIEEPLPVLSRTGARIVIGLGERGSPSFTLRLQEHEAWLSLHLEEKQGEFAARHLGLVFRGASAPSCESFALDYIARDDSTAARLQLAWPYLWNPEPTDPLGAFAVLRRGLDDDARDRVLAAIWAEGTLPHPDLGRAWTAEEALRWVAAYRTKFAGLSETTLSAASPAELYRLSHWLAETGCRRVYLHTDTWRGEYWPRTRSFVGINPRVFPRGREDLLAYRAFLAKRGMLLRLHNVSAGIGFQDAEFVSAQGADPRLATWVQGHLEGAITPEGVEARFRPDAGFTFPHLRLQPHWNLRRFQLGTEIVDVGVFEDVDTPVWRLRSLRRGYAGAAPATHAAGTPVRGLVCAYGQNLLPDNRSTLLVEMAERYATLINEAGLDHQHYDGAEIHAHLEPWGFDKLTYHIAAKVGRPTTSSTSGGRPTRWTFESHFSAIRGLTELGYWSASIPVLLDGHRSASSWLDAHYEIASRLLRPARRLGFYKPEPMFGLAVDALDGHGLMPRYVELF